MKGKGLNQHQQQSRSDTNLSNGWLQRAAVREVPGKEVESPVVGEFGLNRSFVNVPVHGGGLPVVQRKLTIGGVGDRYEQEAEQPPNKTGLPDRLKTGIENLSGYSMDDVRVHYNSDKPAQINAHAYAQGTDIHVALGQEKLLPHEGWHLVQQMQGRVKPTMQAQGLLINDDVGLEREADVMGEKTLQVKPQILTQQRKKLPINNTPVQRYIQPVENNSDYRVSENRDIVTLLPHSLFATKDKIGEAASALKDVKAMVTVTEDNDGGRTPWEPFEGGTRTKTVYPVKLSWVPQTVPEGSVHEELSGKNAKSILHYSWADCHRNAQTVMGSSSKTGDNQEQPLVKQEDKYKTMKPIDTVEATGVYLSDAQANRGIYALFEYAFPRFVDILQKHSLGEKYNNIIERINSKKSQKLDKNKMFNWWNTYRLHILPVPELSELFAKSFGINEYAAPEIGDTLSQVGNEVERHLEINKVQKLAFEYGLSEDSSTEEMKNSGVIPDEKLKNLKDLWNFHWAGVIMKDGADYVTLENLSIENINAINRKWYFKLYGQGKQSFHSEATKDPHAGDAPVTTGFRHVPETK